MSSITGPANATATRREPILMCYDDSRDAVREIGAAAVLDVLPWMAAAESIVRGNAFEELTSAEARRIRRPRRRDRGSAGFDAEPRGELASATWEGIVDVADGLDAAVIVIGSRGMTGMKKVFDASLSEQVAEHAGRPVLIASPPR
jgi:nucleotide-binding universal stress UspA family protein